LYNTANIGWLLFFPTMAFPGINVDAGASAKKLFVCAADDDQILNDMDVCIDVRLQTSLPAKLAHISPFVCDSRPDPKPKKIKEALRSLIAFASCIDFSFRDDGQKASAVGVVCGLGRSRSVAVATAFLLLYCDMTLAEAKGRIATYFRDCRPCDPIFDTFDAVLCLLEDTSVDELVEMYKTEMHHALSS
jgi:hypothetical protein